MGVLIGCLAKHWAFRASRGVGDVNSFEALNTR